MPNGWYVHCDFSGMTSTTYFILPAALTIETVESTAGALLAALPAAGDNLMLDASLTEIITSPGIQLLHALGRSLEKAGGHLFITPAHPAVVKAFNDAGIQETFFGECK
jgi:anti-anti-sigma regulatory factor